MSTAAGPSRGARAAFVDERGIYIHVPFCRRRCQYCDFYFEVRPADRAFASAVSTEMAARIAELPGAPTTLSLGGGTPSLVDGDDIARIVDQARQLGLVHDAE